MIPQKMVHDQIHTNQFHTGSKLESFFFLSNKSRNGTDLPLDRINTLPGKDSHLCLIVCFTSSSEHTISNRLNAGPLTQTGFPDGGRLFHSTGKQQGGGGVVGRFFFFFLQMEWATVLICPTLMRIRMGQSQSQLVCDSVRVKSTLVVSIVTGIILD